MIAHFSIPARDPRATAHFFAAVIDGLVFEFPPVPGACIAVAKDGSGLAVEVYPNEMAHHPGVGEVDASIVPPGPQAMPWEDQIHPAGAQTRPSGFHIAMGTALTEAEVVALGRKAGWRTLACERAGVFGVVEVWIDDRFLVEVLVPKEGARYRAFMNPAGCAEMFGAPLAT